MGIKKVNTTAYHPQIDGLVERFKRTLTDMLAKTVENSGKIGMHTYISYVLFAYRSSPQESSKESPFFLLYGRYPKLPTMVPPPNRSEISIDDYKTEVLQSMQEAWDLARKNIVRAQKPSKRRTTTDVRSNQASKLEDEYFCTHLPPSLDQATNLLFLTRDLTKYWKFMTM